MTRFGSVILVAFAWTLAAAPASGPPKARASAGAVFAMARLILPRVFSLLMKQPPSPYPKLLARYFKSVGSPVDKFVKTALKFFMLKWKTPAQAHIERGFSLSPQSENENIKTTGERIL